MYFVLVTALHGRAMKLHFFEKPQHSHSGLLACAGKNKKRNNGSYQICSTSFSGTAGPFICICRYAVYMQSFYSLYAVYCLFYKSTVINECVKCKIV